MQAANAGFAPIAFRTHRGRVCFSWSSLFFVAAAFRDEASVPRSVTATFLTLSNRCDLSDGGDRSNCGLLIRILDSAVVDGGEALDQRQFDGFQTL